jgi:hypothetical protein
MQQSDQLATPPPANFASEKNEKVQLKEHHVWIIGMYFCNTVNREYTTDLDLASFIECQQVSCTEEIPEREKEH